MHLMIASRYSNHEQQAIYLNKYPWWDIWVWKGVILLIRMEMCNFDSKLWILIMET